MREGYLDSEEEIIIKGELQLPFRNRESSVCLKDHWCYAINPKCTSSITNSSSSMVYSISIF